MLRAGLARTSTGPFVLGSPKAWLGTAYHSVLERLPTEVAGDESLDAVVDRLWDEAIAELEKKAAAHPLNKRFGAGIAWPGYFLALSSVRIRANELAKTLAAPSQSHSNGSRTGGREEELIALEGRLKGTPDVIGEGEVIDYKSGEILEFDETSQTEVVKASYVRQLRIYGYLVKHALGKWPRRGVLLPLAGQGVEVDLAPAECEREATEAVELLEKFNGMVRAGSSADSFAAPSTIACQWCPFKLVCPAFWRECTPDWGGQLDGAVIEATCAGHPHPIHAGRAASLAVNVSRGTEAPQRVEVAPLVPGDHPGLAMIQTGDLVRIGGLRRRPDGVLVPTRRTVVLRVDDVPSIEVGE